MIFDMEISKRCKKSSQGRFSTKKYMTKMSCTTRELQPDILYAWVSPCSRWHLGIFLDETVEKIWLFQHFQEYMSYVYKPSPGVAYIFKTMAFWDFTSARVHGCLDLTLAIASAISFSKSNSPLMTATFAGLLLVGNLYSPRHHFLKKIFFITWSRPDFLQFSMNSKA